MQKTKSAVVNKTGKAEVNITDNQSWNRCHEAASDHDFTFRSATEPTKKKHNGKMRFDRALYMSTYLLQPKQGASAVRMHWSTQLSYALNRGLDSAGKW